MVWEVHEKDKGRKKLFIGKTCEKFTLRRGLGGQGQGRERHANLEKLSKGGERGARTRRGL